ncbi:MAG: AAA family ATPase, partial [Myxococcales bacterium]|nr:AAA family ATPase [Myxococcales bacterium]
RRLTRFSTPEELFGPLSLVALEDDRYERLVDGYLPTAGIAFLDEVFKANSAILNSLLSILNERTYAVGAERHSVPLISAFAASNEVPQDDDLDAVFDRFLLRVHSGNLESFHFQDLLTKGLAHEVSKIDGTYQKIEPVLSSRDLQGIHAGFGAQMNFSQEFLADYKGIIFQIRNEGITISDRRAIKLLKLFAASALLDGRTTANASDFFVLKHIWNNVDQIDLLEGLITPALDRWYDEHPEARRFGSVQVGLDALVEEINRIREALLSEQRMSDIQLFSHMKALNQIKVPLMAMGTQPARDALGRVDELLGHVFKSGKFAQ